MVVFRNCILLWLVATECMAATSGFHMVPTTNSRRTLRNNNNVGSSRNRPSLLTSSDTHTHTTTPITITTHLMAAGTPTQEEEQAVMDFKMITEEESQLRKIGGGILGLLTMVSFVTIHGNTAGEGESYYNYANLSTGAFAALSTYRTGVDYQWGCIVNNSWNIGSPFSFEKVPEQFQDFVKEKQLQIVNNVVTSAVFGVIVANTASLLLTGAVSTELLVDTTKAVFPIFGVVAVASGATTVVGYFKNKE